MGHFFEGGVCGDGYNISDVESNIFIGCNNIFNIHYASMVLINASSFGNNKPRYYYPALPTYVYGGFVLKF